jgi:hypothetical protein
MFYVNTRKYFHIYAGHLLILSLEITRFLGTSFRIKQP